MKHIDTPIHPEQDEQLWLNLTIERASEAIFWFDATGHCRRVNTTACEWVGYSEQELQSLTFRDLCSDEPDIAWPRLWTNIKERTSRTHNTPCRRKDGRSLPAEWSGHIFEVAGEEYLCLFVRDLSHRNSVKEAFEKLKRHHELILNAAADGIFGLDLEGRHTFVNPAAAKMLGYQIQELLGQPSHPIWHHTKSDGSPYPTVNNATFMEPIRMEPFMGAIKKSFGGRMAQVFQSNTKVLRFGMKVGTLVGAVVVFKDISERYRANEQEIRKSTPTKRSDFWMPQVREYSDWMFKANIHLSIRLRPRTCWVMKRKELLMGDQAM